MRSIKVYYADPVTGVLAMKFNNKMPEQTYGVDALLEKIAKLFYTKVGSNVYSPEEGTSIGDKGSLSSGDPLQLQITVHAAVKSAQDQILAEQSASSTNLTPDQLLQSLSVSSVLQGADPTTWFVEVLVVTQANQTFFLTV